MPARVEEMCGLVFVNLDPDATPLAELVGDLPAAAGAATGSRRSRRSRPATGHQPANWKAVADNYLEGYHIPIAHPGLMRMLDYKHYDVEVHDHYVVVRRAAARPSRAATASSARTPSSSRRCPGSARRTGSSGATPSSTPTRRSTCIPDQVNTWQMLPDGIGQTSDVFACYRPPGTDPGRGWSSGPTSGSTRSCSTRTSIWSTTSSRGWRPEATAAARCRVARRRSPGSPTGSAADLAPALGDDATRVSPRAPPDRGTRPDPRRRGAADRQRGHRRGPDRPDRHGRGRLDLARPLPLRQPRGPAGRGARLVLHPRRRRADRRRRARRGLTRRAPAAR